MPALDGRGLQLLAGMIDDLATAVDVDPFDVTVGARVGAALATAQLDDQQVPAVSAQVLYQLADRSARPDAGQRLVGLLAALGQGHQQELDRARDVGSSPLERGFDRADRDERDARFRILFENTTIAIAIGDTDGKLLEANRGLADMIGVPVDALRGISVYDFAHPDDQDDIRTLLYEKLVPAGEGTVSLDRRLVRADGSVGWMSFAISYVKGNGGQPDYLLAIGADVTEQHRLEDELRRQARHDPLTGLPNRRYLLERIDELITTAADGDRAGLCFADLDHFKNVNDRFGHGTGDKVLTAVAARLNDGLSEHDCLVSRLGGDEFVVLVPPPATAAQITVISEKLLSVFSDPITIDGQQLQVAASIGAVVTPIVGANAESLLDAADASLYYAKTSGKGHWVLHTLQALT
ncbi:diguanylate cyclase domain-containing protein [Nocardia sp. NBC_01009]|uniref:diguanylate cyclase domain-containing protein n=1 Tax=Nocardia sp. NBC_01009 TaxID=2975996 RepID=UPI00386C81B5|nr:sensor domain-containing diguanylate cyclase [Nocardia sp. NBC_01009]